MRQRVITGLCLAGGALIILYFGGAVFSLAAIICYVFAQYEEYRALSRAGHRPVSWPTWLAMIVAIPLVLFLNSASVTPILMGACFLTILCILFREDPQLEDILMSIMPLFSICLPGLCVIALTTISPLSVQRTYLSLVVAVPVCCDSAAFFAGSRFGKRRLCPEVSPNKTVAGAVGGMAGAIAAAMCVGAVARLLCTQATQPMLPSWGALAFIGILGGVVSQTGELFASLVKRHCGIKDFSNLFPGHGGMLDRIDSILFMSVVVYCIRIIGV